MKFFYVANIRLPTEKAHGIQIMKMCEAFANLGHEVELIVPKRKTPIEADPFSYYSVEENFKITTLPTIDLVRFGWLGFWIQSITFAESAAWYVLTKKGIFYTRDELLGFFLKTMGKKTVWEVHMGQTNLLVRFLVQLRVPLVVITAKLKDLYKGYGMPEGLIHVSPDAVDLRDFEHLPSKKDIQRELGLPEDKMIISYIGKFKTLGKSKGIEDIIRPFAQTYVIHKNIFLLIVGPESGEAAELKSLLSKEDVPETAYQIVSHVEHRHTPKYIKATDILLMMYPNTTHYALYMSPLKLFEYMASGNIILGPRLPSLEEVLNDKNSYLFDPDDKEDFLNKLHFVIENFGEAEKKGIRAGLDVREHTWEKRAKKILDFIS